MERNWLGLDLLRGLGLFGLIGMHTAFYYFSGLWKLDLENPPLIITIIGFLLMFAGLFAMISGAVHAMDIWRLAIDKQRSSAMILRKKIITGGFILIVAYLYFIFTGPGLADFSRQRMDNSLLVEWIRYNRWPELSLDRLLYVDSLVMIGLNVWLVSLILLALRQFNRLKPIRVLSLGGIVMALSLLRLPLYPLYQDAVARHQWLQILLLNWLVNKNNPLLPYLAFGLLGAWIGLLLENSQQAAAWKRNRLQIGLLGLALLMIGLILYICLPDTMLQRAIDGKWYSIMLFQLGLFMLLILAAVSRLDHPGKSEPGHPKPARLKSTTPEAGNQKPGTPDARSSQPGTICRFLLRFGTAGLTAFFWESVLSALSWRLLTYFWPNLQLEIVPALAYGCLLALLWGLILTFWSRWRYIGSLEWLYGLTIRKLSGTSRKAEKLRQPATRSQQKTTTQT